MKNIKQINGQNVLLAAVLALTVSTITMQAVDSVKKIAADAQSFLQKMLNYRDKFNEDAEQALHTVIASYKSDFNKLTEFSNQIMEIAQKYTNAVKITSTASSLSTTVKTTTAAAQNVYQQITTAQKKPSIKKSISNLFKSKSVIDQKTKDANLALNFALQRAALELQGGIRNSIRAAVEAATQENAYNLQTGIIGEEHKLLYLAILRTLTSADVVADIASRAAETFVQSQK